MDRITIQNLEIFANHGVFQEETRLGQKFLISAELFLDLHHAGQTDNMQDSVHYGEAAAENLARELLLQQPLIRRVMVEIKKPWAPIGLPIETVSVRIVREWHEVFLSVGSNLGDKEATIRNAVDALAQTTLSDHAGVIREVTLSDLRETKAYGETDQPDFLNGAIRFETILSPYELLERLHEIEAAAGRERKERWGARTLDLDILFYDDLILHEQDLIIPHIDMKNRLFVLEPLMDLCPVKVHPVYHKTVSDLYAELSGEPFVNR